MRPNLDDSTAYDGKANLSAIGNDTRWPDFLIDRYNILSVDTHVVIDRPKIFSLFQQTCPRNEIDLQTYTIRVFKQNIVISWSPVALLRTPNDFCTKFGHK